MSTDWSKSHVLSEHKTWIGKACFIVLRSQNLDLKANEEA